MEIERTERPPRLFVIACTVVMLVGAVMALYPWATNLWAARIQSSLADDLSRNARDYRLGLLGDGDALMRLGIPAIDLRVMVVEGTSEAALRSGVGHYRSTALPGEDGNVALAGHRTTYGKPFNRMNELRPGDEIYVTTPTGRSIYVVAREPWVVIPSDWSPVREYPSRGSFLTLMSCHPEGSATHRIVVRARLSETQA